MIKILIVDDEFVIRQGFGMIIRQANKDWLITGSAVDGVEALEMIAQEKPDIIITDVRMPEIDGIELIKIIKQKYPEIFVIIISGYAEFIFAREALRHGAIDYLLKPTKPEDLVSVIMKVQKMIHERDRKQQNEENLRLEMETLRKEMGGKPIGGAAGSQEPANQGEKHQYRKVIELAIRYMEQNYSQDLTLKQIAEVVYMNPSYFCDLFKQQIGQGFSDYLTKIRVDKAKDILLSQVELKSYEVAQLVGYKDSKYFAQIFKKLVGVTPTEFRDGKQIGL